MNSSAYGRQAIASWPLAGLFMPLGVTNSRAFTDEVRSPRLLRTRCKRIVQQLKDIRLHYS